MSRISRADADELYGRPEHKTRLDKYSRARQHDMFACLRRNGQTTLPVGVEAKACEDFDGTVGDRAPTPPPSKKRARCNLLAGALFGRDVIDEESGKVLDPDLGAHGYQLWTAAVGTIIEAQHRNLDRAVLVVHQFRPRDLDAARAGGDMRDWSAALSANRAAFDRFVSALASESSTTHDTPFVKAGTTLAVVKVESFLDV